MNTQQAQDQARRLAEQNKPIGNAFAKESAAVREAAEAAYKHQINKQKK